MADACALAIDLAKRSLHICATARSRIACTMPASLISIIIPGMSEPLAKKYQYR